jgi:glycerol-3-phosphate dehydrogenase
MESFELRARAQALQIAQSPDRELPIDGARDSLPRDARARLPARPVEARHRHVAVLADRQASSPGARGCLSVRELSAEEPLVDETICDGGFEYSDAYLHDNDARFVWGFVRERSTHGCAAVNYVESTGAAAKQTCGSCPCATFGAARARGAGQGPGQRRRPVRRRAQRAHGPDRARATPSRRASTCSSIGSRPTSACSRSSPTTAASFFVIPMGARTLHRHDRHRSHRSVDARSPTKTGASSSTTSTSASSSSGRSPSDVIAERCGVRPLAVSGNERPATG